MAFRLDQRMEHLLVTKQLSEVSSNSDVTKILNCKAVPEECAPRTKAGPGALGFASEYFFLGLQYWEVNTFTVSILILIFHVNVLTMAKLRDLS